jgi:hypothetical protein
LAFEVWSDDTMWIEVDFPTFADARTIAEKAGTLLRAKDEGAAAFLAEEGVSVIDLMAPIDEELPRYVTLLAGGLYRGVFRYSVEPNRAWHWRPDDEHAEPLRVWGLNEMVDVAVSYSSEDRGSYALPLVETVRASGIAVYAIDVAENPSDPLWRIRFREGLMHARFFVPVLTPHYLAREGTQVELADIERMTTRHRSTEHFYPLLPWRPRTERPEDIRDAWLARDKEAANWLLGHIFPLPSEWDYATVARFIRSLSTAARSIERGEPTREVEYLALLAPWISSAEPPDIGPEWTKKFTVRHPWWEGRHYEFLVRHDGRIRWVGLGEIEGTTRNAFDGLLLSLAGWPWAPPPGKDGGVVAGRRFWIAADSHLAGGRPREAAYQLACAVYAEFDSGQWLAKLGTTWLACHDLIRGRAALTASLEALSADDPARVVLRAQLARAGGPLQRQREEYANPGDAIDLPDADAFGFSPTAQCFRALSPDGLRASGDCLEHRTG